jgi:hypothetical protein
MREQTAGPRVMMILAGLATHERDANILTEPMPPPHVLASRVKNKESEKYDRYLGDDLLAV